MHKRPQPLEQATWLIASYASPGLSYNQKGEDLLKGLLSAAVEVLEREREAARARQQDSHQEIERLIRSLADLAKESAALRSEIHQQSRVTSTTDSTARATPPRFLPASPIARSYGDNREKQFACPVVTASFITVQGHLFSLARDGLYRA